ncbi:hypothetical protein HA402_008495 [Bradysia odoriphaga]|nr:hypothetical protein HA402_008495 [Bradysia odoriphaga]
MERMQAWRRDEYGPAEGTELVEIAVPVPRAGEVLVRMQATSLNAGDVRIMLGDPLLVRPVFGMRRPTQPVRGMDVTGVVVAAGPGALGVEVGEEIVGEAPGGGALAEYVVLPASRTVPRPPGVPVDVAACVPIAGGTAWQALDLGGVGFHPTTDAASRARPPRVLILGASGGVGTFAVQLAAVRGAEVWASCGDRSAALMRRLGAASVFDHRSQPLSELPPGHFDAVLDIAGDAPLRMLQRLLVPGGRAVLVTGNGGRMLGPIPRMLRAAILSFGSRRSIRSLAATCRPEVIAKILELIDDGRITAVIEQEFPFAAAGAALARLESGHVVGKLVVHAPRIE